MKRTSFILGIFFILGFASALFAAEPKTMLTVYNQDLALVRQERTIPVQKGVFKYSFEDVTTKIDPTWRWTA